MNKFVDRPSDMIKLEGALLPQRQNRRRKILVLHGLGGIGKTQLAVEFARRHHRRFSSVLWLDGRTEHSLKQSIANSASRIPEGQIAETSRTYRTSSSGDINAVVRDVIGWLSKPDNTDWLLIFDNVDRDHQQHDAGLGAYDVTRYFSEADHGSVLITTRLAKLKQLGDSWGVNKVSKGQAQDIFQNWYGRSFGKAPCIFCKSISRLEVDANSPAIDLVKSEELLNLLDGLPLALAQAAAYLRESGIDFATYTKFYKQQWKDLMESQHRAGTPLQDYPHGSVWTTWTISYNEIRAKNKAAANLLLFWACLDNKDLWQGLLAAACEQSTVAAKYLSELLQDIASNEFRFIEAIRLLHNYSMIEDMQDLTGYATHPVVHRWALYMQDEDQRVDLARLAVIVIGLAVPNNSTRKVWTVQRRLLAHAQCCSQWILTGIVSTDDRRDNMPSRISSEAGYTKVILDAIKNLGILYADQGKLDEAEKMYQRALAGKEKVLGAEHTSTLGTVNNLGLLYWDQGKLDEAEKMYQRALAGKEKALGAEHTSTLETVNNLGNLYQRQGKLDKAEKMYQRALAGKEKALGAEHTSTLETVNNLGNLYQRQGKLDKAEKMYQRALAGKEKALGAEHTSTFETVNNLGALYRTQGKLDEAEKMYQRALAGKEKVLGAEHTSTLGTVNNLGLLYADQGKLDEAEKMYQRALAGKEKALGAEHTSTLETVNNLGNLYAVQGKLDEAEKMYSRALTGFQKALGPSHKKCQRVQGALRALRGAQGMIMPQAHLRAKVRNGLSKELVAADNKLHNPQESTEIHACKPSNLLEKKTTSKFRP